MVTDGKSMFYFSELNGGIHTSFEKGSYVFQKSKIELLP